MTIAVGDNFKAVFQWNLGSEKGTIVRHYQATTVTDGDDEGFLQALCDALASTAEGITTAISANDVVFVGTSFQKIGSTAPSRIFTTYGGGTPVAGNADARGAQQSVLCSAYPAAGGLLRSGRNYFPFLRGDYSNEGQILAANEAAVFAELRKILLDLVVDVTYGEIKPIIYRAIGEVAEQVATLILRSVIASQRRRVNFNQPFGS